jgi:hypothetical protein
MQVLGYVQVLCENLVQTLQFRWPFGCSGVCATNSEIHISITHTPATIFFQMFSCLSLATMIDNVDFYSEVPDSRLPSPVSLIGGCTIIDGPMTSAALANGHIASTGVFKIVKTIKIIISKFSFFLLCGGQNRYLLARAKRPRMILLLIGLTHAAVEQITAPPSAPTRSPTPLTTRWPATTRPPTPATFSPTTGTAAPW